MIFETNITQCNDLCTKTHYWLCCNAWKLKTDWGLKFKMILFKTSNIWLLLTTYFFRILGDPPWLTKTFTHMIITYWKCKILACCCNSHQSNKQVDHTVWIQTGFGIELALCKMLSVNKWLFKIHQFSPWTFKTVQMQYLLIHRHRPWKFTSYTFLSFLQYKALQYITGVIYTWRCNKTLSSCKASKKELQSSAA